MKFENKGLVPVFIVVILLTLVAAAFPALSPGRNITSGTALLLFIGGILCFTIRAGWMKERQSPKGRLFSVVMIFVAASIFAICVTLKDFLDQWPIVRLLSGILGLFGMCAALDRIGALIATFSGKGSGSEQCNRP